jgi:formylglycine-generating enzyme required for sulfatase activity
MRNSLLLSLLSALFVVCGNSNVRAQDDDIRDTREPSVGSKDILERFIGELVLITPGKGVFPESVETAAGELRLEGGISISCYETTQELYQVVMGKNPSRWQGPRNSVESVSYQDVERFCDRLTAILHQSNLIDEAANVRLPTDSEWEYCCRGGSAEPFCFGSLTDLAKTLDRYAWHTGNAAGNDPAVGVLQPNVFGLYDVHGYLWEFVDTPKHVKAAQQKDAQGPLVWAMGGSWRDSAVQLAADSRIPIPKYASSDAIGFRCVVSRPLTKPKNLSNQ